MNFTKGVFPVKHSCLYNKIMCMLIGEALIQELSLLYPVPGIIFTRRCSDPMHVIDFVSLKDLCVSG